MGKNRLKEYFTGTQHILICSRVLNMVNRRQCLKKQIQKQRKKMEVTNYIPRNLISFPLLVEKYFLLQYF